MIAPQVGEHVHPLPTLLSPLCLPQLQGVNSPLVVKEGELGA